METSVNKRILLLKKELGLSDVEFCGRASISTSSLQKIKNDETMSRKTLEKLISAFSINQTWLLTGVGEIHTVQKEPDTSNPWKDALVAQLKEENAKLWQMIQHYTGGAKPNFLKAFNVSGLPYYLPSKSFEAQAAA